MCVYEPEEETMEGVKEAILAMLLALIGLRLKAIVLSTFECGRAQSVNTYE